MELVKAAAIPAAAGADAVHVAIAAVNAVDYLLTWNCAHINNAEKAGVIQSTCAKLGYRCPTICTPMELMGGAL